MTPNDSEISSASFLRISLDPIPNPSSVMRVIKRGGEKEREKERDG